MRQACCVGPYRTCYNAALPMLKRPIFEVVPAATGGVVQVQACRRKRLISRA